MSCFQKASLKIYAPPATKPMRSFVLGSQVPQVPALQLRYRCPRSEPDFLPASQKRNIPKAKIHTGFNNSSARQAQRAFEKITPKKDLSLKSSGYYGKMLLAAKVTTRISPCTLNMTYNEK